MSPFKADFRFAYILPDEVFGMFLVSVLLLLLLLLLTCIGNCAWKVFTFPQERDSYKKNENRQSATKLRNQLVDRHTYALCLRGNARVGVPREQIVAVRFCKVPHLCVVQESRQSFAVE